jgi:UDP-N-acetylmuramate dehydrogenase
VKEEKLFLKEMSYNMKTYLNIDLYKYNTMRLHSVADVMCIPESVSELIEVVKTLKEQDKEFYILGGGSNIVFSETVCTPIINVMEVCKEKCVLPNGDISCGASLRIQSLINFIHQYSLGGIEYLFSVPCTVGGAVYMNAGRGRKWNLSISDYIRSVEYLDLSDMTIKVLEGNDLYSYRTSPFRQMRAIILNVIFRFKYQEPERSSQLIKERLLLSDKKLSADKPSCGSVFNKANPLIMRLFMGHKCGGARFSNKTPNWISNIDNATATDIRTLVDRVILVHKLFLCTCQLEICFFR